MIHDMNKMSGDKLPLGKLPLGNILCSQYDQQE